MQRLSLARHFSARAAHGNNLVFLGAPGVGKGTFAGRVSPILGVPAISTGDIIRAEIKAGSELGKQCQAYTSTGQLVPDEVVSAMVRKRLQEPDAKNGWILVRWARELTAQRPCCARAPPHPFTHPHTMMLQDGYPRTVGQAQDLDKAQTVSRVINITLPESVLMAKLMGRRVCGDCGKNYNIAAIHEGELDMPPLLPKPSDCAKCVGKPRLETRADDTEAIVKDRMTVYHKQTSPLIAYYSKQGKLQDFQVKKGVADMPRLQEEMGIKKA